MRSTVLIIVLFFLSLTGCKRNCSDFNKDILNWVPYQENDVIELYCQSNDSTILFSINRVYVEHTTHYSTTSKCGGCVDFVKINQYSDDFSFSVEISLSDNKINSYYYKIGDTYFDEYYCKYSETKNFLFENKEYESVRIFERDDLKGTFKKLILAYGYGVIGVEDIHGKTWVLKNNSELKKEKERGGVEIHNTSC
jgi:hypothetical protein